VNDELHEGEKPVEPILAQTFEGNVVTKMEAVIPMVTLDMPEGYPVGTHLRFEVEVRVGNVRFEEGKGRHKAEYSRKHVLSTESVQLTAAFLPSELDTATYGTAAGVADLVEDEDGPEQIEEFAELPLDPAFQDAEVDPAGDVVETLDEQISRLAEEEAAAFAVADEAGRQSMADRMGLDLDALTRSFKAFGQAGQVLTQAGGSPTWAFPEVQQGYTSVLTSGVIQGGNGALIQVTPENPVIYTTNSGADEF